MRLILILFLIIASPTIGAFAQTSNNVDQRVLNLGDQIRCMVCANATINSSHTQMANAMRNQIRAQIMAGDTDAEILNSFRQQYGDQILYTPPLKPSTWILWMMPVLLLCVGMVVVFYYIRRHTKNNTVTS